MEIDKLIEQLKQSTFYYYKIGLFIKSPVTNVFKANKDSLSITFNGGTVDLYLSTIERVKRPSSIVKDYEWCYALKNYYDEVIGYIGKEV